ncbi:MAG: CoA transferase [Thermodesulfobacteriota bacterium]|nr:CoA transferase [Thermodesulfobacteriota bacterium]
MRKHLEGIKVLDLTAYLSGPYATLNLAALGADVIKVERPKIGDPCRWNPPFAGHNGVSFEMKNDTDMSILYLKRNRGKRSIFLNLKEDKGKELFRRLVNMSDIVIENFSPGVMERMGLDYPDLKKINPRIIYCSISGYGQDGPFKDRTAFDLTIQATSGIMAITGYPEGPPTRCGAWIGDMIPSLYSVVGILAALYSREKTGQGDKIDIAMQAACFSVVTDEALDYNMSLGMPVRTGNRNPRLAPWNSYKAKDGHLAICVANNTQWNAFLKAIGREDLEGDDRFKNQEGRFKYSDDVEHIVNQWLENLTRKEALKRLREYKVPCDAVLEYEEILECPQLNHRKMIQEVIHPVSGNTGLKVAGFPIQFSDSEAGFERPAPYCGEHNEEVYKGLLGLSDEELEELKEENII